MESQRDFPYKSADDALAAALELHRAARLNEAAQLYKQILVRDPTQPHALYLLGVLFGQRGQFSNAVDLIKMAIQQKADIPQFHCQLAEFLKVLKRYDEAVAALRKALELADTDPAIHNALGAVYGEMRQYEAAASEFRRSIQLKDDFADSHSNLGAALVAAGSLDEAIVELERALELKPDMPGAHLNLGNAFFRKGLIREAIDSYHRVLQFAPDDTRAHATLALAYLLLDDYPRGWLEHEWRLKIPEIVGSRKFSQPRWNGEDLAGKSILVHREQGLGDFLMYARFIPMVAARGARIVLEPPPELLRLFAAYPGVSEIVQAGQMLPHLDFQCPLLSLPFVFDIRPDTVPSQIPYLSADPELVRRWVDRFDPADRRFRVGIAWAGNPENSIDATRSMNFSDLAPLAQVNNVAFYSLQKGARAAQSRDPQSPVKLIDFTSDLTDMAETAALISHLDLVLTIDTSVAHLAGAMGKQMWVMLWYLPDWRWTADKPATPWYPSARLFRQPARGDWAGVMQNVCPALAALAAR